ncbi:MAG: sigma-54-dependent Fis family transcriptional regulator [Burkholderiaceae bacterium]|nr:sigma-54-dependent Fis family transcriptional regulator [Burkholderiaceae bacterium]
MMNNPKPLAGMLCADSLPMTIEKSHQRSMAYGLAENDRPNIDPVGGSDLSLLVEQNQGLYRHALPVMETLYEQIINTHNMVILTDLNGLILHSLGDDDFLAKADRVALKPGVIWSEQNKGTNAIGTAIVEQEPTMIHAAEHYLRANHFLTCSAAPIFDHRGQVIGVLDVTGDQRSFHKHTMALVRMSAQMIENQLFSSSFQDGILLHFNARPEFIGTLMEGIASFAPNGRFLAANRSALFQLGLPLSALQAHTFSSLFGLPVSALLDHYRTAAPDLLRLCLHNGVRVFGRAQLRLKHHLFQLSATPPATADGASLYGDQQPAPQARRRPSGLRYLNTGDPQIAAVIEKVNKVLGRDIPILVMGETGTGKELLAQAIHNDSPRAKGPFVAVNCASIPETLIESELFGYEDGAFTGARKKGSLGKILQANGGTLFLDEIGDMPMSLQTHLLRVLQERMVTPLGSAKSIPVNLELICATNRNLREQIAKGAFREDLYYRLNGLMVKLPAIRERSDLEIVINKILAQEASTTPFALAPDVMLLFKQHNWPGNFRQLTNVLRTAIIMAEGGDQIRTEHLPDDFFEDIDLIHRRVAQAQTSRIVASGVNLEEMEISVIQKSLESNHGNVAATARALGVSRNTIYRKISIPK